jgi:hypothetical protein
MNWREENITEKQKATIIKMQGILDWTCDIPVKRGEACDRIKELMNETDKRIAITGTMRYNSKFETVQDDLEGDLIDIDEIENDIFDFNEGDDF